MVRTRFRIRPGSPGSSAGQGYAGWLKNQPGSDPQGLAAGWLSLAQGNADHPRLLVDRREGCGQALGKGWGAGVKRGPTA